MFILDPTITWILIFERYVVMCEFKDYHHKDMFIKKAKLSIQNMLTILGSIVNKVGGTFMTANEHKNVHFGEILIQAPQIMRLMAMSMIWIC
jgi:hypothetical protein